MGTNMQKELAIGDVVKCIDGNGRPHVLNQFGRVVRLGSNNGTGVGVEFFNNINGHSCQGFGKDDHCWNLPQHCLKQFDKREVVKIKNGKLGIRVDLSIPFASTTGIKVLNRSGNELTLFAVIPGMRCPIFSNDGVHLDTTTLYYEVPAFPKTEMTLAEIEKKLGFEIELV